MDNSNFPSDLRLVSMNIHGRFNGREIKEYGQLIIRYILNEKAAAMLFGQQTNFLPVLPSNYEYMGGTRAFILFDTNQLQAGDEKHYKLYLRDLELQGRLPKNYLPENNFVISKMRTKNWPCMDFIAISFHTDECFGKLRSTSLFRKLCIFLENLLEIEEMQIIVSGSFRISLEEAKKIVPSGFRCCSYIPNGRKRSMRQSNFYICTRNLVMKEVRPIVCGKMDVGDHINGSLRKFINPEDIFYWDPVAAYVHEKEQSHVWGATGPSHMETAALQQQPHIPNRLAYADIKHVEPPKEIAHTKYAMPNRLPYVDMKHVEPPKEITPTDYAMPNRFGFVQRENSSSLGKNRTGALKLKPYYEALRSINASLTPDKSPDGTKDGVLSSGHIIGLEDEQNEYQMPHRTPLPNGRWQESKDSLMSLSGESQCSSDVNLSSSQDMGHTLVDSEEAEGEEAGDSRAQERREQMKKAASFVELYDEELIQNTGKSGNFTSAVPLLSKLDHVNGLLGSLTLELSQSFRNIQSAHGPDALDTSKQ